MAGAVMAIENSDVFLCLEERLKSAGVAFKILDHSPVYTSAEAAAVRGVDLHSGAKALIVKVEAQFVMIVLPADFSLQTKAVKQAMNCKNLRFANAEEVLSLTSLTPGSIPPFGSLFNLPTYCDTRLGDNASINFNAGMHTRSINLAYADYLAVEKPTVGVYGVKSTT
jgi:Ala-tRNA(Pro) deacylase